jgi:hypothetical protein
VRSSGGGGSSSSIIISIGPEYLKQLCTPVKRLQ